MLYYFICLFTLMSFQTHIFFPFHVYFHFWTAKIIWVYKLDHVCSAVVVVLVLFGHWLMLDGLFLYVKELYVCFHITNWNDLRVRIIFFFWTRPSRSASSITVAIHLYDKWRPSQWIIKAWYIEVWQFSWVSCELCPRQKGPHGESNQ